MISFRSIITLVIVGSCTGDVSPNTANPTARPTAKPTYPLWNGTNGTTCPSEWCSGGTYQPREVVSFNGVVYQCSDQNIASVWCGFDAYKPGDSSNWKSAWSVLGACTGGVPPSTPQPTVKSTNNNVLWNGTVCPAEWRLGEIYKPAEHVEMNGIVYKCSDQKHLHLHNWGGLSDYKPGDSKYWKDVWTSVGSCTPAIDRPTAKPTYAFWSGGCPAKWRAGKAYDPAELVASNGFVYQCTRKHNANLRCGLLAYKPGDSKLWENAWTPIGPCTGNAPPTTSQPTVKSTYYAPWNGTVCPPEWREGEIYEPAEAVSTQGKVYQCIGQNDANVRCGLAPYKPGQSLIWEHAWTLTGSCASNVTSVTSKPTLKATTVMWIGVGCPEEWCAGEAYDTDHLAAVNGFAYQCSSDRDINMLCGLDDYKPGNSLYWESAWTRLGSCTKNIPPHIIKPSVKPTLMEQCQWTNGTNVTNIDPWSYTRLRTYHEGSLVRKSNRIYKCNNYPYSPLCKYRSREPEKTPDWTVAWSHIGTCPENTTRPSISPTLSHPTNSTMTSGPSSKPSVSFGP